ncbi:MAG: TetR family transcriptional regulator [Sphingobacteriales bacterium]|nr:MAG: TetR family transcriptional regulator [Sphingobacteriales bacterium]
MGQDSKKEAILEAAKKRFSHFGVGKTTMNEIADDLSISKASLYYYFPDKLNLYAAVLQHISDTDQVGIKSYEKETDPEKALQVYLDSRMGFINKYYNILEYLSDVKVETSKELQATFNLFRKRQLATIRSIIDKGVESGHLSTESSLRAAELLLDCFEGLRAGVINASGKFFPDKKVFMSLLKREKELATIFMRGLSA